MTQRFSDERRPSEFPPRGGDVQGSETRLLNLPPAVAWLSAALIGVFVLELLMPNGLRFRFESVMGFLPLRLTRGIEADVVPWGALAALVTHTFLHGGLMHLVFNLISLVIFGAGVARRMRLDVPGPGQGARTALFFFFYFACGVVGALTFYLLHPQGVALLIGASGAISGLMAAALLFVLRPLAVFGASVGPLAGVRTRPVVVASGAYVVLNLFTAVGLGGAGALEIAWEAHLGGFAAGLLLFPIVDRWAQRI